MKLSVKIASIFTGMTLITIILYLMSSNVMSDYLYQGEMTRITGITSGIMNRLEGETEKVRRKAKEYTEVLGQIRRLNQTYSADFMQELGIYKKFENDGVQSKIILSPQFKLYDVYYDKDSKVIEKTELNTIIQATKQLINNEANSFEGIISTDNHPYIVNAYPVIDKRDNQIGGYIMAVQIISEEMLVRIGNNMNRKIDLASSIDLKRINSTEESYGGQPIHLIYDEKTIESYTPIGSQNGEEKFYIRVTEPLVVKQSTKQNLKVLTGILIILCIIINCVLGILIERLVVKRIIKINRQINKIHSSKDLSQRIEKDGTHDEIGILEEDINKMFDSLKIANDQIILDEEKYSSVLKTMTNGFAYYKVKQDELGKYVEAICENCNDALVSILGIPKEKIISSKLSEVSRATCIDTIQFQEILGQVWRTGRPYTLNQLKIKEDTWVAATLYTIQEGHLAIIINDITTLKHYSEEMKYLAEYDSLTMLKNRHSLYQHLDHLKKANNPFVIYFMDIDNFKTLNDTVGHIEGDKVLCATANALLKLSDEQTTVGRLGGDEFIVIQEGEFTPGEVMQFGQKLLGVVNKKFEYDFYNFTIKASVGVSLYPRQTNDINTLLKYGDIAMYKSKKNGGNSIQIFTDEMLEELDLEACLKDAIVKEEIVPYYQPIFDVEQHKIIGAETLARWVRNGEVLVPSKFIPIAKRIGCIVEIDYFMLDKACEFCKKWHMNGVSEFEISVNISYKSLKKPNCVEVIKQLIHKHQLNPKVLTLEITEDEVLDYPEHTMKVLNEIKALGVKVSLDDFGIGCSSFNHIKMLPLDTIKIDGSLLMKIEEDYKTVSIIRALVELAHTLGLEVVCEGVEKQIQLDILKTIKCNKIQGYYISQPIEEILFYNCVDHYNVEKS